MASSGESAAAHDLVAAAGLPTEGLDHVWATLVADEAGTIVGVAALERHTLAGPPVYLLRSVAVRPDRRGAGLGAALVAAALDAADEDAGTTATIGLLTETADGYFDRFGFSRVDRSALPKALDASPELAGACPATARAYMREVAGGGRAGL